MKLWLSGLALLAVASTAQAENFRIVQSPAQKLDIWIDNIKDNTPQSWCKSEIALRIVANGNKDVSVLENFVPRLGSLLEHQCSKVSKLSWTLNDPSGTTLAQGTAGKAQDWALVVKQQQTAPVSTPGQRCVAAAGPERGNPHGCCRSHAVAGIYPSGRLPSAYLLGRGLVCSGALYSGFRHHPLRKRELAEWSHGYLPVP